MKNKLRVTVGMGSCGLAAGAETIYNYLKNKHNHNIDLALVGCIGMCKYEPIVEVYNEEERVTYVNVNLDKINKIYEEHIINNKIVNKYLIKEDILNITKTDFYKAQTRIVLEKCGIINPENIDEYIALDGYKAFKKALTMKSADIVNEIKESKLRGRGGAGFYTGIKWEYLLNNDSDEKYIICNADEGDPGAFMDRAVLEGNPHSVIEAMLIGGFALKATKGIIYVRAEYPVAVKRVKEAIKDARKAKLLGKNILDTKFDFDIDVRLGAGAFVCGEETALISSIEGKRGEPVLKPPYPAEKGLFGKPTLINNVETLANIPNIILRGSNWFKKYGTNDSSGTKIFALGGKINNPGLVEIPLGTPLKTIIYDIGDGIPNNKKFKAAQTGGPSGGCIPSSLIDIKMDYADLVSIGSMMGSGGLIVMDEDTCMVDIARFFLNFTVDESCGKCTPCRIGNKQLYEMLSAITRGEKINLKDLESLCKYIRETSLCGLGQSAPNPVLSTLKYFEEEYKSHIVDKKCPAHSCQSLILYKIDKSKCIGCGMCARNCPAKAIAGKIKGPHEIDPLVCIKCGLCYRNCKFKAVVKE